MSVIVVKLGGVASDNLNEEFFQQIKAWQTAGKKVVIVHGGGHYISEMAQRLGIEVQIRNGLRVTDDQTLDITRMVLIGQVQPMITTRFLNNGFHALGLSAGSDQLIQGIYKNYDELGHVGEVADINAELLNLVLGKNHVPIIAPLGITQEGQWLNINADEVACKIAAKLQAEQLFLLTDVPGIKKGHEWLKEIPIQQVAELEEQQVITGGMIPKLKSAQKAILAGVKTVCINDSICQTGTRLLA